MNKQIVLYFISLFFATNLLSQPCNVSVDALKGKYTGDCKDGNADGQGTATGMDLYTGSFKNGYPDGQGKYTWKNGNWYEGLWKKGLFDGQGTLSQLDSSKPGSSAGLTGFWQKGKYVGKYEKPYIIQSASGNINEVNVRKLNNTESTITITLRNTTGGGASISNNELPKSRLIDVQQIEGQFEEEVRDETSSTVSNKYTFKRISYPFYAIFSIQTAGPNLHVEKVAVEFFERCNWYVQVGVDN